MSEYTGVHHSGEKLSADIIQSKEATLGLRLKHSSLMNRLISALHLEYSIGYVQFLQLEDESFTIFDVQFGLPLYDKQLNKQILSSLTAQRALSPSNLQNHSASMQKLADELTTFVTGTFPESIYVFADGKLHIVDPSALT